MFLDIKYPATVLIFDICNILLLWKWPYLGYMTFQGRRKCVTLAGLLWLPLSCLMGAKWCSLFIPKYDYMVICVIERLGTSGQCKDGICHSVCPVWCVVRADTCRLFDVSIRDGRPAGVGKTASVWDQSSPGKIAGQYGFNSADSG